MRAVGAPMSELLPLIAETVENGGEFTFYPRGRSMLPYLSEGRDAVILSRADELRRGDVVLYKRKNGAAVLHRIVACRDDCLTLCGDNQFSLETGVPRESIVARMTGIMRGGRQRSVSSLPSRLYISLLPARRIYLRGVSKVRSRAAGAKKFFKDKKRG